MRPSEEEVVNNEARCPYCNSRRTVLNGVENGKQTYLCKERKHRWKKGGALGGHSFPPDQIGTGIQKYYTGLSFRGAAKAVKEQFGLEDTDISPQTIRNWVHRYTDVAVELTKGHKADGGGPWWLCSQPFGLYLRMWWMVLDETTGYILASHIDPSRTQDGARDVLLEALASAVNPCDGVAYMKAWPEFGWVYEDIPSETVLEVIREIFPDQEVIEEIEDIPSFPSGSVAARILPVYEATRKRFERIRNDNDLRRYIAGWVITSNLFTEHRELGGRTPGQAAGVKVPVADWADVVRLEAQAYLPNADA